MKLTRYSFEIYWPNYKPVEDPNGGWMRADEVLENMPQALTWQPIATAPADRSFLVWPITMKYPAAVRLDMALEVRATHWLDLDALPQPPTGETQEPKA